MNMVDFLLARITEDEDTANKAAKSINTRWMHSEEVPAGAEWENNDGMILGSTGYGLWDCEGSNTLCMDPDATAHMALHDPARVLAECNAKRLVLKHRKRLDRTPTDGPNDGEWGMGFSDGNYNAVLALAAVYADHPDYNKEWAL